MARKALLVGLNDYANPANNLKGCINDVRLVSGMLQAEYGFAGRRSLRLLTNEQATSSGIKHHLAWLVDGARPGDVLVFHYSGHGAQVRDRHGDELDDGLDEIICPYDMDWDDPFTDDDLHAVLGALAAGVNLTVVLDCCHSGTGLREAATAPIPFRPRVLLPPVDIRHGAQPTSRDVGESRRAGLTRPQADMRVRRFGTAAAQAGAILIAGCKASQVSADAWIDGDNHGALTYYLWWAAADAAFRLSYSQLITQVRALLKANGFDQVPQLEGPRAWFAQPLFASFVAAGAA